MVDIGEKKLLYFLQGILVVYCQRTTDRDWKKTSVQYSILCSLFREAGYMGDKFGKGKSQQKKLKTGNQTLNLLSRTSTPYSAL